VRGAVVAVRGARCAVADAAPSRNRRRGWHAIAAGLQASIALALINSDGVYVNIRWPGCWACGCPAASLGCACDFASYCSPACMLADRERHKHVCLAIAAAVAV
jgi:hypothetical protein